MSSTSVHIRVFRRGIATAALLVALSLAGSGYAQAASTVGADSTQFKPVPAVLGVPVSTAVWAVLGLTLVIAGLVASSRSIRHPPALRRAGATVSVVETEGTSLFARSQPETADNRVTATAAI